MASDEMIVIPCLNEERHLPGLLDQLLADDPDRLIVVADGGSRDQSCAIVARYAAAHSNILLMHNPDRIQSAGVNRAVLQWGTGRRWLVRVDAHCLYPDRYVSGLIAAAKQHEAISVVVPMITVGTGCFQRAVAAAQNSVLGTGGSAHRSVGCGRYVDHGHHALMDIAAFMRAGGYNQAMSHNEDAELDLRLAQHGAIWLEPGQTITYFPRSDPAGLWRQYLNYGKGRAQTIGLHRIKPRLRQLVPLAVPIAVLCALLAPLWWVFALPLIGWVVLSLAFGALIGLKARSACALMAGPAAMIMHLAWGVGFIRQRLFGSLPAMARPDLQNHRAE